jgi:hypothetical protein
MKTRQGIKEIKSNKNQNNRFYQSKMVVKEAAEPTL